MIDVISLATGLLGVGLILGFLLWFAYGGYKYVLGGFAIVSRFWGWVKFEFDNPFARQVVFFVQGVCKSQPLTYFMLGMSVEALGLGLQYMFAMDVYPLLDFLVAGIIATALYVYQNRKVKNV